MESAVRLVDCVHRFDSYSVVADSVLPILAGVGRGEEGVNCIVLERACHYELIQPGLMWLLSCDLLAILAAVIY